MEKMILGLLLFVLSSCNNKHDFFEVNWAIAAGNYQEVMEKDSIESIRYIEERNYYIVLFKDSSAYLVSRDAKVVRKMTETGLLLISTNASNDIDIPIRLFRAMLLVNNMTQNNLWCVENTDKREENGCIVKETGFTIWGAKYDMAISNTTFGIHEWVKLDDSWYICYK